MYEQRCKDWAGANEGKSDEKISPLRRYLFQSSDLSCYYKIVRPEEKNPMVVIARMEAQKVYHSKSSSKANDGPTTERSKYHTKGTVSPLENEILG